MKLDITKPVREFSDFLHLDNNDRIIFSGRYGVGKTTFLKAFFSEHDEFVALALYPINYSIATNEDIFTLIKYDLLYELLDKGAIPERLDTSVHSAIEILGFEDTYRLFKTFVEAVPLVGKRMLNIIAPLEELVREIRTKKQILEEQNDSYKIKLLHERLTSSNGNIFEQDIYTEIIIKLIAGLRQTCRKKIVLVVDDLDRIDPEHIFRILNVFAAHFDSSHYHAELNDNKFGLDKVVICCDIDNIQRIFHHRYGPNVDFKGYVNKFHSNDVFLFDNDFSLAAFVSEVVSSMQIKKVKGTHSVSEHYRELLIWTIVGVLHSGNLNLRQLLSWMNRVIDIVGKGATLGSQQVEVNFSNFAPIEFILVLEDLFQGLDKTAAILEASALPSLKSPSDSADLLAGLVTLSDINKNKFLHGNTAYSVNIENVVYSYNLALTGNIYRSGITECSVRGNSVQSFAIVKNIPFRQVLIGAIKSFAEGRVVPKYKRFGEKRNL